MSAWGDQPPLSRRQARLNALASRQESSVGTDDGVSDRGLMDPVTDPLLFAPYTQGDAVPQDQPVGEGFLPSAAPASAFVSSGRRASRPEGPPSAPEPPAAETAASDRSAPDLPTQPMTRRERRAMEAALAAQAAAEARDDAAGTVESDPAESEGDSPVEPPPAEGPPPALVDPPAPAAPQNDDAVSQALANLQPPSGMPLGTSPTQIPTMADLAPPRAGDAVPARWIDPEPVSVPVTVEPVGASAPDFERGVDHVPVAPVPPVGQWADVSDQLDIDAGPVTSRDVGTSTGPITSSALVLPAIPEGSDLSVPFTTSTGEVLVTGSITLPAAYGTTGPLPRQYDHSDLDAIIDAVDRDDVDGDAAPVRAIKAVSTHTSPRDVIAMSSRKDSSRLPIVLSITAGVMMVSVTVLVVVGFMFDIF